jgi:hypothetical protein
VGKALLERAISSGVLLVPEFVSQEEPDALSRAPQIQSPIDLAFSQICFQMCSQSI